jgi:hypothetical protein
MWKTIVFLFFILVFIPTNSSYAAPCYGTKMPGLYKFFAGVQTHNIFNRYLENEYGEVRSLQHFFQLSYGAYEWLSIDLKGGAGYIKQHPLGSDEVDYPSGFAGGYGFRVKFYDEEKIKAVFGFQHVSVHPQKIELEDVENTGVLDDWQVSLLASYEFKKLTPYLGTKWSRVDYIHWVEDDRERRMSDLTKSLGLVCGLDFPLTDKTWLNLEGQLFDTEAVSFSINYQF